MEQSHTRWDDWRIAGLVVITATTICLYCLGVPLDTSTMTALASATLLIFGMPHGSFDLALLQRHSTGRGVFGSRIALILLYLTCAGAMYLLWRAAPVAALTAFLLMSVIHFAEDWEGCGSPFIAGGIALALISAPSLLHGDSLSTLFVTLSGRASAAILADYLLLVAPTMLLLAIAGVAMLWHIGRRPLALSAACALLAMLVLARVLQALVMAASPPAATAYIADVTSAAERTRGMGKIGAAHNFGTIVGPALGGALAVFGLVMPLYVVVLITATMAVVVWRRLPESPWILQRPKPAYRFSVADASRASLAA